MSRINVIKVGIVFIGLDSVSVETLSEGAGTGPRLWPAPGLGGDHLVCDVLQGPGLGHGGVGVAHPRHPGPDGLQHGQGGQVCPGGGGVTPVSGKQTVSVRVNPPCLARRGHACWLGGVGHHGVGLGQTGLDAPVAAE